MRVKITRQAHQFTLTGQSDDLGDRRRYYVAQQETGRLVVVVCRHGLELADLVEETVDASLGWEPGTLGFVHDQDVSVQHSKLTIYRKSSGRPETTLARIMGDAPARKEQP